MIEHMIIDDIDEILSLATSLLTVRHIVDSNIQYQEYSYLDKYITYPDYKTYSNDIALFFREITTSAVLNTAVNAYRLNAEIVPLMELTIVGLNESRLLDEITDMKFIQEFDIFDKKENVINLFIAAVNKMTDALLDIGILDKYRYISIADMIRSGIVISVTNDELKILEER